MAVVDATGITCLVVPEGAVIVRVDASDIRLRMQKALSFKGVPVQRLTPLDARRNMGLAWRESEGCLQLGTFGEFSTKEGGASIQVIVDTPRPLAVERSTRLSGHASLAAGTPAAAADGQPVNWYAPPWPAPGWRRLADTPDVNWR